MDLTAAHFYLELYYLTAKRERRVLGELIGLAASASERRTAPLAGARG